MPQVGQAKTFPGYGVVYPDGASGIKVVRTYTEGPKKTVNPDGSVSYTTPPPVIHELYAGAGFVYASGKPVSKRDHLENITDESMRERALEWFDRHGRVMKSDEVITFNPEKERPEPDYICSDQIPSDTKPIPEESFRGDEEQIKEPDTIADLLRSLSGNISTLVSTVNDQGKQMSELAKTVKDQGQEIENIKMTPTMKMAHKKQGETMKKKWADPAYREKMLKRIKDAKTEEQGE